MQAVQLFIQTLLLQAMALYIHGPLRCKDLLGRIPNPHSCHALAAPHPASAPADTIQHTQQPHPDRPQISQPEPPRPHRRASEASHSIRHTARHFFKSKAQIRHILAKFQDSENKESHDKTAFINGSSWLFLWSSRAGQIRTISHCFCGSQGILKADGFCMIFREWISPIFHTVHRHNGNCILGRYLLVILYCNVYTGRRHK